MKSYKHPKLVYTWDYRMRWAPIKRAVERGMGGRPYPYDTQTFLEDYTRAFAWLARYGYDGIVIWGLFRDSHGGISAVRDLCKRAADYGMAVIAGVGVNCYGGMYWEGNHPYNLSQWLQLHPELAAIGANGMPVIVRTSDGGGSMLCPSRPENLQWYREGLHAILNEVSLHGIWYETGDYGRCRCSLCANRPGQAEPYSYADFAHVVPTLMDYVHSLRPDLIQIAISYGTIAHYKSLGLKVIEENLPKYAWFSWLFEGGIGWACQEQAPWRSVLSGPSDAVHAVTGRDIAFLCYNCYAGFDERLISIERIRSACGMCHEKGIKGLMLMGELCEPSNLINYIALDFFMRHPRADVWDCLEFVLSEKKRGNLDH